MSTPGQGSILGSPIIYGKVDYGPTHGQVYRPLNQKRVVTAAGNDTVQPFDQTVIYKKTVPAAFQVTLPDVRLWMTAPYGGFDLMFVDGVGNAATYPITFVPFGTQTIDGATGNLVMDTNNGTLIFVPLVDKSGWTLVEAWPAAGTSGTEYFNTFEELTSGAAPVNIDPSVFHTRVTTGGTAGTEVVNFPDYDSVQAGKPHLVTLVTRTNVADVVSITGSSDILGSAFGPLATRDDDAVVEFTTMLLSTVEQGFVLTWTDFAWQLVEQVHEPAVTFANAGDGVWGYVAPSVLIQQSDNKFAFASDSANPQLGLLVTANAVLGSAPNCPAAVYGVGVISAGNAGVSHIDLETPFGNGLGTAIVTQGQRHVIWFKTRTNGADTVSLAKAITAGRIKNSDGSAFTSVIMTLAGSSLVLEWAVQGSYWKVIDGTLGMCTPEIIPVNAFPRQQNKVANYTVTTSDTGKDFCTFGSPVIFTLPPATQSGHLYTFSCLLGDVTTIQTAGAETIRADGSVTSVGGTLTSSTIGSSVTIQDVGAPLWIVTSLVGVWTVT